MDVTSSSPVVRACYMNVYNESFEETRYSLWLSNTIKTLPFSPKEGSMTMTALFKYEDDREFGKLGLGNDVEIESPPMSKKTLAFTPNEGSVIGMLKFRGHGDFGTANGAGLDTPICAVVGDVNTSFEERVQNQGNNGFGNEVEIEESLNHTPNFDTINDVINYNFGVEDIEGLKRKETNGEFVKLGVSNGVEIGSPEYIVSASDEFIIQNFDVIDDVNISHADKEDEATGELKKEVVKKGQKRLKNEEDNGELRREGFRNKTEEITVNTIEFQNLGCDVAYSSPKCDFNANIDINDGKHENMDGVLRNKVLMKGSKRAREQECSEDREKAETDNEAKIESSKVFLFNAYETQSSGMPNSNAVENVDLGSSKAIEFSSLSSDIVKYCASNLLVDKNHGSHVMCTMEIEKANPFHDASENVNDDANTITIKEQKTLSDVRAKEVMESLKRMDKEEPHRDLGKMEVDNEFTPISKLDSDSGAPVETESLEPDHGASYTVEIESVKTNADKEEKEVRAVRKKVTKKGLEKVKKKKPIKIPALPSAPRNPAAPPPSFPDGASPPAVKSRLCNKFNTAEGCRFGDKCHYAHGEWELGKPTAPPSFPDGASPPAVKSRICNKFNTAEGCRFGDKCHYAHGEWELGKPTAPPSYDDPRGMGPPPMGPGGGFGRPMDQPPPQGLGAAANFGASATAKISVDGSLAGAIIGKGGVNTKNICRLTGAKVAIRDHESDPKLKNIEMEGTFGQINQASVMVLELITFVQINQASAIVCELINNIGSGGFGQGGGPPICKPHMQYSGEGGGGGGNPSLFKTRLCENIAKGSCAFGDRCHFAHGAEELRKGGGMGM